MIQSIQIYRSHEGWSMQVGKMNGSTALVDKIPNELIADLLVFARAAKTPEEKAVERAFEIVELSASTEQLLEVADIIPEWELNEDYKKDQVRRYEDKIYRCIQAHDSQVNREPDVAVSLWVEIGQDEASGEEIIDWFEPTADHYFGLHQLMRYTDGKVYKSLLNTNTWSPEQFARGWQLIESEE